LRKDWCARLGLERAVMRTVAARTYGVVATRGCHGVLE
jgi:hypothetical protein